MNRFKELTKNTVIIMIGRISTQLVSFFLLPLYTAILSTKEYGIVDLVVTIIQLIIPISSLMVDQGIFRNLLTCKDETHKKGNISSAIYIQTILNLVLLFIFFVSSYFLSNKYAIWVLLILIVTSYSNLLLQIARGFKKTTDYAIGSFICSSVTIVLNVICLVLLKMGTIGMLLSVFCGNLFCSLYLIYRLKIYNYFSVKSINNEISKSLIKYSSPLIPNQISLWIMNSSDRIIVTYILGTASNGILAISHKFPAIFMSFYSIFLLAWHESGTIHFFDEDKDSFFSEMFDLIISLFATICIFIILFIPLIFNILINSNYFEAYYNIPIYMVGFLLNIIIGFLGAIYIATKKTVEIAKTTILAAILNIIIHLILIKFIGLYAAAVSTFISYLIATIYRLIDSKKYLTINYNYKKIILLIFSLTISFAVYYMKSYIISISVIIAFIPVAFYFNKNTLNNILNIFKEKRKNEKN